MARKYQFKTRGEAEEAYREADRGRLRGEWFATAILQGRTIETSVSASGERIGYFVTTHSAIVYAIHDRGSIHAIRGLWDSDSEQLGNVIAGLLRYEDSHEFGRQLDEARRLAWQSLMPAATKVGTP